MKFDYDKLEQLANEMNELYCKCDNIIAIIHKHIRKQEQQLIENNTIDKWALKKVYPSNPFEDEFVRLFTDDNAFYFDGRGVGIYGATPNYMDGYTEDNKFIIPLEWLELDGEELEITLHGYAQSKVNEKLLQIKEQEEKSKLAEIEKAKELLKKFSREDVELILNDVK